MKQNINLISLKTSDFQFDINRISEILELTPTYFFRKGDKFLYGGKKIEKIRQINYWEYCLEIHSNDWVQVLFNDFIETIILPRKEFLVELSKTCNIEIAISIHYYDGVTPSFHFDSKSFKILQEFNAELDIDIYVLENHTSSS